MPSTLSAKRVVPLADMLLLLEDVFSKMYDPFAPAPALPPIDEKYSSAEETGELPSSCWLSRARSVCGE